VDHSASIPGWGSDLDPAKRPGVPYDKAPQLGAEHLYPDFPRQPARVTVFKSTEHGQFPPVFGTSCPPSGLSGMLRAFAYKFSEGRLTRWLTLLVADRVNVVEGIASDLARLHVPNIPREMGLASELRYNREAFVKKAAITAGAAAVAVLAWRAYSRRR